jgi:hypothetical protein
MVFLGTITTVCARADLRTVSKSGILEEIDKKFEECHHNVSVPHLDYLLGSNIRYHGGTWCFLSSSFFSCN